MNMNKFRILLLALLITFVGLSLFGNFTAKETPTEKVAAAPFVEVANKNFSESFCEAPIGINFYENRKNTEIMVMKDIESRKGKLIGINRFDKVTIFRISDNKSYGVFYDDQERFVGLSLLFVQPYNKQNADIIYKLFIEAKKDVESEPYWKFVKNYSDSGTPEMRGIVYECSKNSKERLVLSLSRDTDSGVIGIDMFHHLKDHGLRDF